MAKHCPVEPSAPLGMSATASPGAASIPRSSTCRPRGYSPWCLVLPSSPHGPARHFLATVGPFQPSKADLSWGVTATVTYVYTDIPSDIANVPSVACPQSSPLPH